MKTTSTPIIFLAICLTLATASGADNWRQFRGPTAQGYANPKGVFPEHWSESEHIKWKTDLPGEGWSSPVVEGAQIWMTTALEEGKSLHALCVDFQSGKLLRDIEVFRNEVVPPKHRRNSYASPTPILDGDRLYVHFGSMGTACLATKDGTKLWENRDLVIEHQNGAGGSPTLSGNKLLIACDGMDFQYEVALDKFTGKVLWKTERSAIAKLQKRPADMRKAYGTPFLAQIDGQTQSLITAAERLYAYDPETGHELWYVDYPGFSNVPLPVTDGKILVTATGFMKPEVWGIKVGGAKGDVTTTHVLWKQNAGAPTQASPLLVDGRVYLVNDGGIASCLDAMTGRILWKERIGSDFAASPVYANGHIYFFDCLGKNLIIEPGEVFKPLAKNELSAGLMGSPAFVDNCLVVRTKTSLYRIE